MSGAAASNVETKTVNGTAVTIIRPNGCTPVSSFVYTYGSGTGNVSTNGINGDSLVSYNGKSITYDAVGNPVNYLGNTLTWDGRTLTKYVSADGSTTVTYTYDLDGVRTSKTVTEKVGTGASAYTKTTEYRYTYEGTTLLHETRLETYSQNKTDYDNISEITYDLYYTYSALGTLAQIEYTRTVVGWNGRTDSGTFLVTANSRGDIECLRYSDGTLYAEYEYDAWGNILDVTENDYFMRFSGSLCDVNPVRYRGYYFDEETGLYYCIGRYYDPEVGRWISPEPNAYDGLYDSGTGLSCYNVYAYCGNNPVVLFDYSGEFAITAALILKVFAVVITGLVVYTVSRKETRESVKLLAKGLDKKYIHNYSVYVLVDDEDYVQYVGRTKRPEIREKEHLKNPYRADLHMEVIASGLTEGQARIMEQTSILYYDTYNPDSSNPINNQIQGISFLKRFMPGKSYSSVDWKLLRYVDNVLNDEILNKMEDLFYGPIW